RQTVPVHGCPDFDMSTSFCAGPRPNDLTVGDFNNDGFADVAVTDFLLITAGMDIPVLLGNGCGLFTTTPNTFRPDDNFPDQSFTAIASVDFNKDGLLDVAATSTRLGHFFVYVLRGNGDGT